MLGTPRLKEGDRRAVQRILLVFALTISLGRFLQQSNISVAAASQEQANDKLIQGIQLGELEAITESGKSGNKTFIPFLKQELKRHGRKGRDPKLTGAVRLALARLGGTEQLQQFWCSSLTEDPSTGLHPTLIFGQIGGWFGIQALEVFLTPEGQTHWRKAYSKSGGEYDNDVIQMPPAFDALEALPKIVPNPPVRPLSSESHWRPQDLVKIWKDWIAAHKDELSKLEPTGEGVDFSDKACKNGKATKKHKD
jgi:hypothetical protein